MLGEFSLAHIHLAAPANGPAPADGIDIDAKGSRGLKHGRANGKAPTFSRRGEDDQGVLFGHPTILTLRCPRMARASKGLWLQQYPLPCFEARCARTSA